jgi:Membrane bound beta barrel domain (DUF5777)
MKKNILFIILFSLITTIAAAQDGASDSTVVIEKDKPVRSPFESGYLIDAQTTVIQNPHTLEAVIQHKFGTIQNGHSDLWGVFAPGASIRLAIDYVAAKNFQLGIGINNKNMTTDLNAKWTLMQQTRKNTYPVAIALYGNIGIDGRNLSAFESGNVQVAHNVSSINGFRNSDRISYFSQIIVGRKFNNWLTLQTAVSFTHYNLVGLADDHDKVGVHFNGRIKVTPQGSLIFNYDAPLKIKDISEQRSWTNPPKSNLSFGYEVSTSTHTFQMYIATATGLIPQENLMWNQNDLTKQQFQCGFNITRLWGF